MRAAVSSPAVPSQEPLCDLTAVPHSSGARSAAVHAVLTGRREDSVINMSARAVVYFAIYWSLF